MPRGRKKQPPLFDRRTALLLSERYIQGETYKMLAEGLGLSPGQVQRTMEKHKVLSDEDKAEHWKNIMQARREAGIQVGRKPQSGE